jgi:hypothetical protein
VAALLAKRDRREPARLGIGCTFGDRGMNCGVERMVGEVGQRGGDIGEIVGTGQIADRHHQREPAPRQSQRRCHRHVRSAAPIERGKTTGGELIGQLGSALQRQGEEWGMALRTVQSSKNGSRISGCFHAIRQVWRVCFATVSNKSHVYRF